MSELPNLEVKSKTHPLIATLPPHLKDPANYQKIRKVIIEALAGKCSHAELMDWAGCFQCQQRFIKRREVLKSLGFKNAAQYVVWQRTHEKIIEFRKVKLPKYNS